VLGGGFGAGEELARTKALVQIQMRMAVKKHSSGGNGRRTWAEKSLLSSVWRVLMHLCDKRSLFLVSVILLMGADTGDEANKDVSRLQGTWKVVAMVKSGVTLQLVYAENRR
jgi:hypothetical protein